jgi:hypothetical protein
MLAGDFPRDLQAVAQADGCYDSVINRTVLNGVNQRIEPGRLMLSNTTDCARLYLLIQRLLDQDLLGEMEAVELLAEADAARWFLQAGDERAVLQKVARVGEFTRDLVKSKTLALAKGRAIIQLADGIVSERKGTGE